MNKLAAAIDAFMEAMIKIAIASFSVWCAYFHWCDIHTESDTRLIGLLSLPAILLIVASFVVPVVAIKLVCAAIMVAVFGLSIIVVHCIPQHKVLCE